MGKDMHLVNIYLKIHNKQCLTMDDLRYLAEYSPECFEKTCKNVVYNMPETRPIMEPEKTVSEKTVSEKEKDVPSPVPSELSVVTSDSESPEQQERQNIEKVLENIKSMEINELPVTDIDANQVKNLLGNLYMELLFPHNDKNTFMEMSDIESTPTFDKKA